jgi:carboxypeptidase Q
MNKKSMLLAASLTAAFPALSVSASARDTPLEAGLKDDVAWDIVEGMTTEVGQRQGGTEAEARARTWSVAKLKALGLTNARVEEFQMPTWVRGEETAHVTAPFPHKLHIAALGNSGSTGADGLEAEVVYFKTLADLRAAPDGSLKGKIAFVSHAMQRTQDGSSYGAFGPARFVGRQAPIITAIRIRGIPASNQAWRRFRRQRCHCRTPRISNVFSGVANRSG